VEREVQYFKCEKELYKKWKCPKIEEERRKKQEKALPPKV